MPNAHAKRHSVVIVDDHPLFRRGLRDLLEMDPDIAVVTRPWTSSTAPSPTSWCST